MTGLAIIALLGAPAAASVSADRDAPADGLVPSGQMWSWPAGTRPDTLWTWPEERTGFLRTADGFVAVDLDSGAERGRVALSPPPWWSQGPNGATDMAAMREHTAALDRSTGRLYVPYLRPFRNKAAFPLPIDVEWPGNVAAMAVERQVCLSEQQFHSGGGCVGGYHVLDARTLEVVQSVRLENVQVDLGLGVAPILRAMVHSPPQEGESPHGKLLIMAEDMVTHAEANLIFGSAFTRNYGQTSVTRLAQVDAATGTLDWVVRIEPCRGTRDEHTDLQWALETMQHPWPTVAMRSTLPDDRSVYVGCNTGGSRQAVVVRVPLDERGRPYTTPAGVGAATVTDVLDQGEAPGSLVEQHPRQQAFAGPEFGLEWRADPASNRLLVRVNGVSTELWWVFDPAQRAYVGAIGIGDYHRRDGARASFDPSAGRLYIAASNTEGERLFVADIRNNPIPQALVFPLESRIDVMIPEAGMVSGHGSRTLYAVTGSIVRVWRDHLALPEPLPNFGIEGESLDVDEAEGVTTAAFDGSARGYGARLLFVGGVQGAARASAVDPLTTTHSYYNMRVGTVPSAGTALPWNPCLTPNRELVLAFVGPDNSVSMTADSTSGGVQPIAVDPTTRADGQHPMRCGPTTWEDVWQAALFGRPPADEPDGAPTWLFATKLNCVTGEERTWREELSGAFAGHVVCGEGDASGWAHARGVSAEDVSVSEAVSSFRIYRDPGRGLVSRVESVARGVVVGGVARIDTVRGTAEAWANGRRQPVAEAARPAGYDGNCDLERTAGSCFQRHVFGFRSGPYSCGPCGDEEAFVAGFNQALGAEGRARFREPDALLARGSGNGYGAAIVKSNSERFADLLMNEDLLQTTVPTLEIVRYASSTKYGPSALGDVDTHAVRGRQVVQLAGVEVSATYGIECLLVYDPARNVCGTPVEPPALLTIGLRDDEDTPLTGGVFEVRRDTDADGAVGLDDALLPEGVCRTAVDHLCTLTVAPGDYLVSQTAAPPGYVPVTGPHAVSVAGGEQRTVLFTNLADRAVVQVTARDPEDEPVSGATFALHRDSDADGAPDGEAVSTCVSGPDGTCGMTVPVGAYVLVLQSGPDGATVQPVPFAFTASGQTAVVELLLEPGVPPAPAPAPAPGPTADVPTVSLHSPVAPVVEERVEAAVPPPPISAESEGGTVVRVLRAPGDVLRLLGRRPREAVAWAAAVALLWTAAAAVTRRRRVLDLFG